MLKPYPNGAPGTHTDLTLSTFHIVSVSAISPRLSMMGGTIITAAGSKEPVRRAPCPAEPNAMQDAPLLAVVEAARRPTDPADSRFRTTARPGLSTSIRTIYCCGVPDWRRCLQWREPGGLGELLDLVLQRLHLEKE